MKLIPTRIKRVLDNCIFIRSNQISLTNGLINDQQIK